jgi:REP element-mobilizing transposase RayT
MFVHIWFHTHRNVPWISEELEALLIPYVGGIVRSLNCSLIQGGCADNHAHLLIKLHPKVALESLVKHVKGGTSRWLGETRPSLVGIIWQHGYGAFSVNPEGVESVVNYIKDQRKHHSSLGLKPSQQPGAPLPEPLV